jgi:GAF domain-containing protein
LTRPAPGSTSAEAGTAARPLASLLANGRKATDLLPQLHQHALDATGGVCSLLFQQNPGNGTLQATSGFGLDELRTDPWIPGAEEAALVVAAFERRAPTLVADADRQMPDLSARLNTPATLLLPLLRDEERVGLLAVGFVSPPPTSQFPGDAGEAADAFVTALELIQLRGREELLRDVRALLDEFAASLSATLNLSSGLDIFCHGANRLFAADRTSVWIHDRRARHLVLQASSDTQDVVRGLRISNEDATAPATAGMRAIRSEIISHSEGDAATALVTVPLRGTRRALGAIVFEGVRVETGGELGSARSR